MGGADSDSRFWQRIEGTHEPQLQDARHWVSVYSELLETLISMRESRLGEPERIDTLIRVFEARMAFWSSALHDAPVHQARSRRVAPKSDQKPDRRRSSA